MGVRPINMAEHDTQESEEDTVEVPHRAAVIGSSLLKKNARAYYEQNRTAHADVLHSMARQLNEHTDVSWKELDEVTLL